MLATAAGRPQVASRREIAALFAVVGAAALGFLVLTGLVWHAAGPVSLDRLGRRVTAATGAGSALGQPRFAILRSRRLAVAAVGLGAPAAVAALAGLVVYVAIAWRDWIGASVAVAGPFLTGALTEYVAKPLIDRHTPSGAFMFPSGHTGGVAAVCIAALVVVYRNRGGRAAACAAPVLAVPVLLVGLGVVHLGFHWSTDVAGGITLAGTVVGGLTVLLVTGERVVGGRADAISRPGRAERCC